MLEGKGTLWGENEGHLALTWSTVADRPVSGSRWIGRMQPAQITSSEGFPRPASPKMVRRVVQPRINDAMLLELPESERPLCARRKVRPLEKERDKAAERDS